MHVTGDVGALQGTLPPQTVGALRQLVSLFGLSTLAREAGDFLEDGYLSRQQVRLFWRSRHQTPVMPGR